MLGLAVPTLVVTGVHHEVFDFGRWQAVAWVFLFAASVTSFATLVARPRPRRRRPDRRPRPRPTPPGPCSPCSPSLYGTVAVVLWAAPGAVSDHGPIAAGPMGLRFLGSWAAFLALCARYAGVHGSRAAARLPVAALVAFPIAGLVATVGHLDDLPRRPGAPACSPRLAVLAAAGLSVQRAARRVVIPTTRGGAVR